MKIVVGLGSNLGDRLVTLRRAVDELSKVAPILSASTVYETAPVGEVPQGPFLNAAVLVAFSGARALFRETSAIEQRLGRIRRERWGPRTIDLDLLWAEEDVKEEGLVIPHPRLHERAFAVVPLLELLPDLGSLYSVSGNDLAVFAPSSALLEKVRT